MESNKLKINDISNEDWNEKSHNFIEIKPEKWVINTSLYNKQSKLNKAKKIESKGKKTMDLFTKVREALSNSDSKEK